MTCSPTWVSNSRLSTLQPSTFTISKSSGNLLFLHQKLAISAESILLAILVPFFSPSNTTAWPAGAHLPALKFVPFNIICLHSHYNHTHLNFSSTFFAKCPHKPFNPINLSNWSPHRARPLPNRNALQDLSFHLLCNLILTCSLLPSWQ